MKSYGHNIPRVLENVERERQFRGKVLGPIGRYVHLQERRWAKAVGAIIGNLMDHFIVESFGDKEILKNILQKERW